MQSKAKTVAAYLAELPAERRAVIEAMLEVIRKNIDPTYEEGILYGMICYYVPHSIYPAGYHCDPKLPVTFAGLAAQKNYYSFGLMCLYEDSDFHRWFVDKWQKTGQKLDMGKSCIRFKKLADLPLDLIGEAFARVSASEFITNYEAARASYQQQKQSRVAKKTVAAKKVVEKAAKNATTKKQLSK